MDNLFSVWLVPEEKDKEYLDKIIKRLAGKYSSPIFIPHLTLLPNAEININELKTAIEQVFQSVRPFKIKTERLNQSEAFFKTVFIEFELDEALKNLFLALSEKTDKRDLSTFKPHLSLMYKIMPEEEKIKIVNDLNTKDEFTIGSVMINKNDPNDYQNVNGWRIVYRKDF